LWASFAGRAVQQAEEEAVAHARPLASVDEQGRPIGLDPDAAYKPLNLRAPIRRHRVTR